MSSPAPAPTPRGLLDAVDSRDDGIQEKDVMNVLPNDAPPKALASPSQPALAEQEEPPYSIFTRRSCTSIFLCCRQRRYENTPVRALSLQA